MLVEQQTCYWGIFCYHPPTWRQRRHLKATYIYTLYGIETHRCTQSLLQSVQPMDLPKSGNRAPAIFMVFTAGLKCWEGYQAHGNLAQCSQKRLVIDFIWYFLQFFLWLQPWLHLDIQVKYFVSSYDKYRENLTKISFWARCLWEQIFKIRIFEVASGFGIFKQNRDGWTLCYCVNISFTDVRPDFIPNVTSTTGSDPSFLISDMTRHLVLLSFRFLDVTRLRNSLWYKKSWVTKLVYMESHCWTAVLCSSLFERFWDCYKLPGVLWWGGVCGGVISRQMHHNQVTKDVTKHQHPVSLFPAYAIDENWSSEN